MATGCRFAVNPTRFWHAPQLSGMGVVALGDLDGSLSLYGMEYGGSVPIPILTPEFDDARLTLSNFWVFDGLKIVLLAARNPVKGSLELFEASDTNKNITRLECPKANLVLQKVVASVEHRQICCVYHEEDNPFWAIWKFHLDSAHWDLLYSANQMLDILDYRFENDRYLFLNENGTAIILADGETILVDDSAIEVGSKAVLAPDGDGMLVFSQDGGALSIKSYPSGIGGKCQELKVCWNTGLLLGTVRSVQHMLDNRYMLEFDLPGGSQALLEVWVALERSEATVARNYLDHGVLHATTLTSWSFDPSSNRVGLSTRSPLGVNQIFSVECTVNRRLTAHTREQIHPIFATSPCEVQQIEIEGSVIAFSKILCGEEKSDLAALILVGKDSGDLTQEYKQFQVVRDFTWKLIEKRISLLIGTCQKGTPIQIVKESLDILMTQLNDDGGVPKQPVLVLTGFAIESLETLRQSQEQAIINLDELDELAGLEQLVDHLNHSFFEKEQP